MVEAKVWALIERSDGAASVSGLGESDSRRLKRDVSKMHVYASI